MAWSRSSARSCAAAASAVSVPTEPPLTRMPSVPSGMPIHCRSQSSVASSSADAPAPPVQLPAKALWPVPIRSASTLTGLLGLPMRAKKRGWSARWPRGRMRVEELVDGLLRRRSARRGRARCCACVKPGSIGAIGGWASSCSQRSTSRSHTWWPRRAQLVGRKAQRVQARDNRAMRAAVMRSFEEPLVARGRRRSRRARRTAPCCACSPRASAAATGTAGWATTRRSSCRTCPGTSCAARSWRSGPRCAGWAVGDRVTVPFCCGCGVCEPCRQGETQVCERDFQPGFTAWGSFAELVALPRADLNLVRVPPALSTSRRRRWAAAS